MAGFKKDFTVAIQKLTKAISQRSFGTIMILDTTKAHPYTLYNGIDAVAVDYAETTEAYKIASRIFGQPIKPQEIAIVGMVYDELTGTPPDLVTFLNTVVDENSDWFTLTCTKNKNDIVIALSNWINTQEKMYYATTQDLTLPPQIESEQTTVMFHHETDAYVAEGLASYMSTAQIGGVTAKFKTIQGVKAANITATQLDQLHKDGGFSYVRKFGILQTTEGKTTSGEYIDVTLGSFWIQFKLEEELAYLSVNTPKIPYSNTGIAMLVATTDSVLKRATLQGIVLEKDGKGQYVIEYTTREDTSKVDIASRNYTGIKFTAQLSGAVHDATLNGFLTY